jgi:hypothetical protein
MQNVLFHFIKLAKEILALRKNPIRNNPERNNTSRNNPEIT